MNGDNIAIIIILCFSELLFPDQHRDKHIPQPVHRVYGLGVGCVLANLGDLPLWQKGTLMSCTLHKRVTTSPDSLIPANSSWNIWKGRLKCQSC